MSDVAAIAEGLNIGNAKQPASDYEAKQEYIKRYSQLGVELDNTEDTPEGAVMWKEIEEEMEN
jgi:hypothetical protein